MSKSGIVNVRMVITEEKILSNIDKVQKLINPKSKKQIVQLEEDTYFKDLIESIKTYLIEYPKKKNFPSSVYKAAYGLVEFATNQFEDNTKKIETLIRQRENNIALAGELKELVGAVTRKDNNWKDRVKKANNLFSEDILDTLKIIGRAIDTSTEDYQNATKLLNARINNLESNLHIEIDMERIEDRSKALSYIGIEIADALRTIPTPIEQLKEEAEKQKAAEAEQIQQPVQQIIQPQIQSQQTQPQRQQQLDAIQEEQLRYEQETRVEMKPSLWQRIKNSKVGRAISYIMRIRVVIDVPNALPEGRGENY